MNTNNPDPYSDDERFLREHPSFDRAAYGERVDQAARNLSVGVNAALLQRKPRRTYLYWLAPAAVAAACITLFVLIREQPTTQPVVKPTTVAQLPANSTTTSNPVAVAPAPQAISTARPTQRRTFGKDEVILEPLMTDVSTTELTTMAEDALLDQIAAPDIASGDLLNITSTDIDRLAKGYDNEIGY